jgi:ABC-2 type transport system ATP-binding protein
VSIVRSGRTVESGPLATLRHLGGTLVEAEVSRPVANLDRLPGVSEVTVDGNLVRCTVDSAGLEGLLVALSAAGVTSLRSSPPSLEELFLRYYGDPGASAA